MSNSESFHTEKDPKSNESDFSQKPILELENECQTTIPEGQDLQRKDENEGKSEALIPSQRDSKQVDEDGCEAIVPLKELNLPSRGEFQNEEEEEEEDGEFRTPTSVDHKIPSSQKCPPAPRKPKSNPIKKRKASPNVIRRLPDLSQDIEAIFPPFQPDLGHKTKRRR